MMNRPLLRNLKVELFEEASAAALQTAINDWLEAREEERLVDLQHRADGSSYNALILYAEE